MATADSGTVSRASLAAGGVAGVAAYVVGYLVAYVWTAPRVADALRGFNVITGILGGEGIPTWKGVAWLFYNGHFVRTRIPTPGGAQLVDFLAEADDGSLGLMYVIVIALVVAAGIAAVRATGVPESLGPSAIQGAQVAVGYLPAAAIGAFLTRHTIGDATLGPDPLPAVLVAGVVLPAALGAVGGVLASRL